MKYLIVVLFGLLLASPAEAHRHSYRDQVSQCTFFCSGWGAMPQQDTRPWIRVTRYRRESTGLTARPRAWCGWYMQVMTGIHRASLNVARNWASIGSPAGRPRVGAIVVWPHHVGKITGVASNGQWIVKSGNDGHAVRERPRSVAGAIAFRMV